MIIGLTGTHASGKDTVAHYLEKKNFIHFSHSDVLREDLDAQGVERTRENLQQYANKLRTEKGPSILARRIQEKVEADKNYVVTSVRNPEEVKAWQEREDFVLIWVDADPKVRFERSSARTERGSESVNETTFESFIAAEQKEWDNKDPNAQQLKACKELANETIINDSTLEELYQKIDSIIGGNND